MKITYFLRTPFRGEPSAALVKQVVKTVLHRERIRKKVGIDVILVDGREMRGLHRRFLGIDRDTDVMAFPYPPGFHVRSKHVGDIYISLPMAKKNARKFNQPLKTEICRLVVHGVLHLLGYDDREPSAKANMWMRQEKIVKDFIKLR